jgi:hypothetical protein
MRPHNHSSRTACALRLACWTEPNVWGCFIASDRNNGAVDGIEGRLAINRAESATKIQHRSKAAAIERRISCPQQIHLSSVSVFL